MMAATAPCKTALTSGSTVPPRQIDAAGQCQIGYIDFIAELLINNGNCCEKYKWSASLLTNSRIFTNAVWAKALAPWRIGLCIRGGVSSRMTSIQ
jgi:hypothetical protein